MPYEIPTDMKQERGLLGPLTVKQSIVAVTLGGTLIYLFFFARDMNLAPKLAISLAYIGIGFYLLRIRT